MATTIQVSERLKKRLLKHKDHPRQPYEEVIMKALDVYEEDERPLGRAAAAKVRRARKELASGKFLTTAELIRELGL